MIRDIVVVEFLHNGEVIFRGSCSQGDEEFYLDRTRKIFSLSKTCPIRFIWFSWEHNGIDQYHWSPKKVREWLI